MDVSGLVLSLVISVFLNAFINLLVPVIIILCKEKYTEEKIKKIVIINSVSCLVLFMFLAVEFESEPTVSGASILWGGISYALLKKYCLHEVVYTCRVCGIRLNSGYICQRCYEHTQRTSVSPTYINTTPQQTYVQSNIYPQKPQPTNYPNVYNTPGMINKNSMPPNPVATSNQTVNKNRFCTKCGAELIGDSKFCRKCGMEIFTK